MRRLLLCGWVIIMVMTACDMTQRTTPSEPSPMETFPSGVLRTATPFLTNTPLPTRTLANPVRLAISPTLACEDAPRTRLIVGERGRVLDDDDRPLNIREAPGTDSDILGRLEILEVFDVISGPQCEGIYAWFFIRHGDLQGWIAEGDLSVYYVEPYLPG